MAVQEMSAHHLFAEHPCAGAHCSAFIPEGASYCRACIVEQRKMNGSTGSGNAPRGRFEARVLRVAQIARALDQADAEHRVTRSRVSHAALLEAFREYRRAARLLDQP